MTDKKPVIHERLKAARNQAGLSQAQVATLMSVHRQTITQIEAGDRRVTADELAVFARHYHVSLTWLLGQEAEDTDPRVELAARSLQNLRSEDLDRVLNLLKSLKRDNTK